MNSLNILSTRVIGLTPPPSPSQARRPSYAGSTDSETRPDSKIKKEDNDHGDLSIQPRDDGSADPFTDNGTLPDEKKPLLGQVDQATYDVTKSNWLSRLPKKVADAFIKSLRLVLASLAAPGVWLLSCLYDEGGRFRLRPGVGRRKRSAGARSTAQAVGMLAGPDRQRPLSTRYSSSSEKRPSRRKLQKSSSSVSQASNHSDTSAILPSDSENPSDEPNPARHIRSKSGASSSSEDISPARRSIRIKLYNEDSQRGGKGPSRTNKPLPSPPADPSSPSAPLTAATLKSPTSPTSSLRLTRYPRAPNPPRPLIPRRTPSYTFPSSIPAAISSSAVAQKTLILDLDETLIHSMAKGGRMSTGHMVEVKLNGGPVGFSGGVAQAPRHPILYYVHKRPHCDDFLRKVCKWYTLIAFTASVQEYADPVIDWLEQDRKYFSGRYYRQHCTFRGGNYIKDISSVEPDLSKVMIVDNSPSSYVFHEDNAIPIEGWINDPTDNDLLHLVPFLEGMQYVTDVRALLALRAGEPMG